MKQVFLFHGRTLQRCDYLLVFCINALCLFLPWMLSPGRAQVPPITSSGLNTHVSGPIPGGGQTQYNITGGTRPNGGTNLFHSFGDFGVPSNNIANFLNTPLNGSLPPTSNILGRVTGGNISNIFGTIQTTGFGSANLFLMNPAGVIFGPNATLNIGGMATFTTADYLKLADVNGVTGIFHANPSANSVLTAAPVAAFGFLGSNPGAIAVQGSQLTVADSTGISLVGGNIIVQSGTLEDATVRPATLTARGGQINLATIASPGEVSAVDFMPTPGTTMGTITLSQGSLLDVSADAAGTVRIRGGQLAIDHATISADTGNVDGAPVAIDINVADSLSLSHDSLPVLTARTSGTGNAGDILLSSGSLEATFSTAGTGIGTASLIDSHTTGTGHGGNINISTGSLVFQGDPSAPGYFIDSGTGGEGNGGHVQINASDALFKSGGINTGDNILFGFGSGGNLTIKANSLVLESIAFSADSLNAKAGAIEVEASGPLTIAKNSFLNNISFLGENPISLRADHLIVEQNTRILSGTAMGTGGDTSITARIVEFKDGSTLATQTFGDGDAGSIHVVATEAVRFLDDPNSSGASGLFTTSFGDAGFGTLGKAGDITIDAPQLEMTNGARLNTTTLSAGRGGNISITASDKVSITGERTLDVPEEIFNLGGTRASGIYTRTVGAEFCGGACGDAGNVTITTGSLTLHDGGLIDSGTTNNGRGGGISITTTGQSFISGTMIDGTPGGIFSRTIGTDPDAGAGGNITLNAGHSVTISEGAQVSASTTGPGNAGNISIQGLASPTQSLTLNSGATITAQTLGDGDAGKITVVTDSLDINGSIISADTLGDGNAGGIEIQAGSVTLTGFGSIGSSAFAGSGNAGSVHITATDQVSLSDSAILSGSFSESPTAGHSGQVFISSPVIDLQSSSAIATSAIGHGNAGAITLQTNSLTINFSEITSSVTGQGQGGTVAVLGLQGPGTKAQTISLSDQSQILTETTTVDRFLLPGEGAAGNIDLAANQLSLTNNSKIGAETRFSQGHAGNISIDAPSQVVIASNSEVSSRSTAGVDPAFQYGNAGSISLTTPSLAISEGGTITASTETNGTGGAIVLNVDALSISSGGHLTTGSIIGTDGLAPSGSAGTITIQGLASPAQSVMIGGAGSGIFTATQGSGAGGNISVSAQAVTLQNGGQISSSSTGSRPAGNINLTAGNQLTMTNSSITTEATQSGGGIIKITTDPSGTVELTNSKISASVLDGTGGGGSVNIDPQFVILQNSQILAEAVQGTGGDINITITNGGLFLPDATSRVSASSDFGQQGTVTIQAPIAPAGGKIQPLGAAPLQVTALLSQRCAAIARGEVSSFVVAGRDTPPTEPGGWLPSPLAFGSPEAGSAVQASAPTMPTLSNGSTIISLRRMPSSWSLVQPIEDDWFTGCAS